MRYSHLVGALIVGAAWYQMSNTYVEELKGFGMEAPGVINISRLEQDQPEIVELFRQLHGDPQWKTLFKDISVMWLTPLDYDEADFKQINVPTLIIQGDRDNFIPVEQAVAMYHMIPESELAVIPGSDHMGFMQKSKIVKPILLDFLLRHRNGISDDGRK